MAHETCNLWLKTQPPLPVYLAWPFIAIAAVTDTYGWHQTVGWRVAVRLMCAYRCRPFSTVAFFCFDRQKYYHLWKWHVAQSYCSATRAGFIHLRRFTFQHYGWGIFNFVKLLSAHWFKIRATFKGSHFSFIKKSIFLQKLSNFYRWKIK